MRCRVCAQVFAVSRKSCPLSVKNWLFADLFLRHVFKPWMNRFSGEDVVCHMIEFASFVISHPETLGGSPACWCSQISTTSLLLQWLHTKLGKQGSQLYYFSLKCLLICLFLFFLNQDSTLLYLLWTWEASGRVLPWRHVASRIIGGGNAISNPKEVKRKVQRCSASLMRTPLTVKGSLQSTR